MIMKLNISNLVARIRICRPSIPSLWESYTITSGNGSYLNNKIFQSFTVGATPHTLTSFQLRGYTTGSPGTLNASIKAVDGDGLPTGADLSVGSINADGIGGSVVWFTIPITEVSLNANTKYALIVQTPAGDGSNYVTVYFNTEGTYDGGNMGYYTTQWNNWSAYDLSFKNYGV